MVYKLLDPSPQNTTHLFFKVFFPSSWEWKADTQNEAELLSDTDSAEKHRQIYNR